MAEAIGPNGRRIKFAAHRTGVLQLPAMPEPLRQLSALMQRLEASGMVPLLDDGLVGGNCAMTTAASGLDSWARGGGIRSSRAAAAAMAATMAAGQRSAPPGLDGRPLHAEQLPRNAGKTLSAECANAPPESSKSSTSSTSSGGNGAILVSRSGKQPGAALQAADWVLLTSFDAAQWQAEYWSADGSSRPTSDAPLHAAALGPGCAERWGWSEAPQVAVHGHALAEGAGLERARQQGLPVSEQETLFSTPEDLAQLEALFRAYPYPQHRCYIRRSHGFLLLATSVEEAEQHFEQQILPLYSTMHPG